jgi:glycosyltransferase involved in cell wall biosynthesis
LRPDVVHTHGYRADVLGGLAVGTRSIRVTTVHGFTGGDWKNRFYEWLQIRTYRRFDAVVAVSRSVRERLQERGLRARRLELIPNAFSATGGVSRSDARAELGLPADAKVVGWVGRLSVEKGADVLLAAAAQLTDRRICFSIIGEGQERAALEAQAAALGIGDRISWHGLVPGAGRLMPAFDLFVLSSRTEGTPIALFEAMAAAVPAVATTVGGVPDVLDPDSGWLIRANSPEHLAQAIEHALSARSEAERRAARARERLVRDFATGPWIDRYLELYLNLVAGERAVRS